MMHLCARAAAPAAIKNKHAFSFPSFPFPRRPINTPKHTLPPSSARRFLLDTLRLDHRLRIVSPLLPLARLCLPWEEVVMSERPISLQQERTGPLLRMKRGRG